MRSEVTRQLATLLMAGIPLAQSLELLRKTASKPCTQDLCLFLKEQVEQGVAFSKALKQAKHSLDPLSIALVIAGEHTGELDRMLERAATHQEKTQALTRKLKTALVYPCTILLIGGLVLWILLVYVVPTFESLYHNAHASLPLATTGLLRTSSFLKHHGLTLGFVALALGLIAFKYKHRLQITEKLPLLKSLAHKAFVARFARTLATAYKAGLSLPEGLALASNTTSLPHPRRALEKSRRMLLSGSALSSTLKQTGLFPNSFLEMVKIGEETGKLDELLEKTALFVEDEYDCLVTRWATLFEPMLLLVLGCLVGGFLLALYAPLFELGALW